MFRPDQPIKSYKEDILGRKSFAQSLGDAILSYKEKESIVIGLFGEWGSGKTSIINMAIEHVNSVLEKEADHKKPIIVNFNPWNYSDQNQLISQFFRQLSLILRRPDYSSSVNKAGKRLEIYGSLFEPLALIPVVGPIFYNLSKVFKSIGNAIKRWGNLKSNDLNSIREELNELLAEQPHKILIVIDDVDRLNDTEIRQIFQLVKSLGDFPNTIYLLAFDKNVVIKALMKVQKGSGQEYLEKVVQIPFEVPLIPKQEVEKLLSMQLSELLRDMPEARWDQDYWSDIYDGGLKCFFGNIRDVNRYINTLRFGFEMVKEEVNPIDFLAITAIQVFSPELYYGIRDNKDVFSGIFLDYERSNEKRTIYRTLCDQLISRANEPPPKVLKDLLRRLFPKLDSIYGNTIYLTEDLNEWRKKCRICSPDIFEVFFRLSLPRGEMSQNEIQAILSLASNPESFAEALLRLQDEQRVVRFLDRLEDYTESEIPEENIETIISVLMDIGDLFPEGNTDFSMINTPMRIMRLLHQMLERFDNQEKRFTILKSAIGKAERSLYTIVLKVSRLDHEHRKQDLKENSLAAERLTVSSEQLDELKKIVVKKIEKWHEDGRLIKHSYLQEILFRLKEWGYEDKVKIIMDSIIKDNAALVDFVTSFIHRPSAYQEKTECWVDIKAIEKLVDLAEIEKRVRQIISSAEYEKLDDCKKPAIKIFLDTIDGKTKEPL